MTAGSLSLVDIVEAQDDDLVRRAAVRRLLIFMVAGFAETNRPPFDLPEADAELVGGYNTEFGGMRFGSFFMAEYINMIVISGHRRRDASSAAGTAPARRARPAVDDPEDVRARRASSSGFAPRCRACATTS